MGSPAPQPVDQYVGIVPHYVASKRLPFRALEGRCLASMLGSTVGVSALDLACGDGWWARELLRTGAAARVHGVDLSPDMVAAATAEAARLGLSNQMTFSEGDCAQSLTALPLTPVTLVTAIYLFNYARTEATLRAMAAVARAHTAPGGRLVAINDSPFVTRGTPPGWLATFGFTRELPSPAEPGATIHYTFRLPDGSGFSIDNFWLPPAAYEAAFRDAGFASFVWVPFAPPASEADAAALAAGGDGAAAPSLEEWVQFCAPGVCPFIGFVAH